jgi:hypothetical protein
MDINRNNYETFFLDYLDRELSPADRQSVEKFISENADLQKEFLLLQQTILSPADIVFEPKASLFREEDKRRVVPFYRTRVAAAVAVLILGSWYMKTIISKNHVRDLSGKVRADAGKKNSVSESKSQGVTIETRKNTGLPTVNKNQTALISPAEKTPGDANKNHVHDRSNSKIHDQSKSRIHDPSDRKDQNPSHSDLNEEPENQVASAKSSSALELQSADRQTGTNPEHIPTVAGTATQALVISTKSNDPQNENTALKERDFQNDNAISVVGLNDRNKAITGFFKKLTKRAPADENARKLRVSVFQISY